MNASTQHIIHRFNLTLESPSTEGALALCDSLPFFLREEVLPELGAWLSRNYPGEAHLRLDKLDLEVDVLAGTSSESELKMRIGEAVSRQFQAALSKALNEAPKGPTPGVQRVTPDRGTVELLCHFLKTGRLPWWAGRVEISELEHRLEKALARERDHLKADLQPLLQNDERVAQRLSTQFSFSSQEALLLLFAPSKDWERWKADAYILLRLSTQWTGEALTEGLPPLKETLLRQMARQAFRQAAAGKALSATPEMPARIWIRTMARRLPQAISPSSARQSFNEGGAFWRYAIEKWPTRKVSFSLATFKKLLKEEVAQTAKEETSDGFIPDKKATASPTSLAASLDREMKANIPGQAKTTGTEQHSGKTKRRELRHPGRETQT
ncbi:MAG: hypothetical protein KDD06_25025, partial [Phaeodactylibacter sp.]|nr:hypothetical protein [Phaeodactylibacter sp.]